ncbi:MAG: hypothetical protein HYX36_13340 [Rhizobiales bacterium]|nr:hypothetical protein [Hyphomicrobiales bacterium]
MTRTPGIAGVEEVVAGHDDLLRILGDIEESKILDILALRPSVADLESVALWAVGEGESIARAGHPLTGVIAEIYEILTADEEDPQRPS